MCARAHVCVCGERERERETGSYMNMRAFIIFKRKDSDGKLGEEEKEVERVLHLYAFR